MELPNYTRLLMQQLRALRKEGKFCDCSIIVGDTPHRTHKLVLAASSLLFRSLLEGTGSICIDTDLVSSQEFSCVLDMVYTGKMSPGKHNFTRIIAAADSLQIFDVGNKNIDTNLMRQLTTQPVSPPPTATQSQLKQFQSQGAKHTASPVTVAPSIGECGVKIPFTWTPEGTKVGEGGLEGGVTTEARVITAAKHSESMNVNEDRKEKDGPSSKTAHLQLPESTAGVDHLSQGGANMVGDGGCATVAESTADLGRYRL